MTLTSYKLNYRLILVAIMLIIAAYFRFVNLGYADLQGDEAKVFFFRHFDNLFDFLLSNSKGPGQYIVVKIFETFRIDSIDTELYYRLPFALAGFLAVFLFYYISQKFFNFRIGFYVLAIAALNGLFIAFSRIIQYQSFNILFGLLSTYFFLNFLKNKQAKDLHISGLLSSVALLFHYDALAFIVPQLILIFSIKSNVIKNYARYIIGLCSALAFFIPYILNEQFAKTLNYILMERTASDFTYGSVFYSVKLSNIYFPKEYLIILLILVIGMLWKLKIKEVLQYRVSLISLSAILIARFWHVYPYKPFIYLSALIAAYILFLIIRSEEIRNVKKYFLVWFMTSFITYVIILTKPLTHIYTVYVPLMFLVGYQLNQFKSSAFKYFLLFLILLSGVSFNYHAYIENKTEYPWQRENYIFGRMYRGISEGETVRGIFGFPFSRNLSEMTRDLINVVEPETTPIFNTNLKLSRLDFYLNKSYSIDLPYSSYYIEIKNARDPETVPAEVLEAPKYLIVDTPTYAIYKLL